MPITTRKENHRPTWRLELIVLCGRSISAKRPVRENRVFCEMCTVFQKKKCKTWYKLESPHWYWPLQSKRYSPNACFTKVPLSAKSNLFYSPLYMTNNFRLTCHFQTTVSNDSRMTLNGTSSTYSTHAYVICVKFQYVLLYDCVFELPVV